MYNPLKVRQGLKSLSKAKSQKTHNTKACSSGSEAVSPPAPRYCFSSSDLHQLSFKKKDNVSVCCYRVCRGEAVSPAVHKAAVDARLLAALLNEAADPPTHTHTHRPVAHTQRYTQQLAEIRGCV